MNVNDTCRSESNQPFAWKCGRGEVAWFVLGIFPMYHVTFFRQGVVGPESILVAHRMRDAYQPRKNNHQIKQSKSSKNGLDEVHSPSGGDISHN